MNIAIIGSRRYPRLDLIYRLLLGVLPPKQHLLTGDARGVDAEVAAWCSRLATNTLSSHTIQVFTAHWSKHGKQAGPIRNAELLATADALIAFWDLRSPGTNQVVTSALQRDLPVWVYGPAGELQPQPHSLFGAHTELYLPDMSGPEYLPLHQRPTVSVV